MGVGSDGGRRPSRARTHRATSPNGRPAEPGSQSRTPPVGESEGEERGAWVASVAGPPADLDLLGIRRVACDEPVGRGIDRPPREQAHRQVERAPPCVHRRRTTPVRSSQGGEDQCCSGGDREVGRGMGRVVRGVVVVLVQRSGPPDLLGSRVDPHRADRAVRCGQHLPSDLRDRPVRCERDAAYSTVGVLDHGLVAAQVEADHERSRAIRGGQRHRLPSTDAEAQGGVLELGLRRRQSNRPLPEHLRVRVQRVAGGAPHLVREGRPLRGHGATLLSRSATWAALRDDRGLIAPFVEEVLRLEPPSAPTAVRAGPGQRPGTSTGATCTGKEQARCRHRPHQGLAEGDPGRPCDLAGAGPCHDRGPCCLLVAALEEASDTTSTEFRRSRSRCLRSS